MAKLTKNRKLVAGKIEPSKVYTLSEAAHLVKEVMRMDAPHTQALLRKASCGGSRCRI